MSFRLGLDLGSTSLGWCLLNLDKHGRPIGILDMGIRIFPDGRDAKSHEPTAVTRRLARGARRNRDRRLLRKSELMQYMIEVGIMPASLSERKALEKSVDPYNARARASEGKVSLPTLGRALFHINQRRGFKSNLKTDKKENDLGPMKMAIKDLDGQLIGQTLGTYLNEIHKNNEPVRIHRCGVGSKARYNFYADRSMYQKEVDNILDEQSKYHPEILSEDVKNEIKHIIFHQRPLKSPEIGRCSLEPDEPRAHKALPSTQLFRLYQEVNNLTFKRLNPQTDPILSNEQKKKIAQKLLSVNQAAFSSLRTLIKVGRDISFSIESEKKDKLEGATTDVLFRGKNGIGKLWDTFTLLQKDQIVTLLLEAEDEEKLLNDLSEKFDLSKESATTLFNTRSKLPTGYGRISQKAIYNILPHLEEGFVYSEAAAKANYHHSDFRTGEVFEDELPYYGQILQRHVMGGSNDKKDMDFPEKYYGKVNNPTVHIAMNQLRKLTNEIIQTYGRPNQIVIETAQDLMVSKAEIEKEQTKNKKDNDKINENLILLGVKANSRNRMIYKLWEDLHKDPKLRCCPFSGDTICETDIFSGKFEEEHLLPFSRSFNDGRSNKVLASKDWNRRKNNKSPYEAFGHTNEWNDILARAKNIRGNKEWRFAADAWERVEGKDGIIARMLNDTRYMTRLAHTYLSALFDYDKGASCVWTTAGQMTAIVRRKLGLNDLLGIEDGQKDRSDHRHHGIDAFVIALCDRGLIKQISDKAKQLEEDSNLWEKRHKLVVDLDAPFDGYLDQLKEKLNNVVISFKPDHGNAQKAIHAPRPYTTGRLHEDSALGLIKPLLDKNGCASGKLLMAKRVPIDSLKKIKNIEEIGDDEIRKSLLMQLSRVKEGSPEWDKIIQDYSTDTGTRRVRIHIKKNGGVLIGISSANQPTNPYKYYATGGNYCADIFISNKGPKGKDWQCEVISTFNAHKKDFQPEWKKDYPMGKRIMRLQAADMVSYEKDGQTIIARVQKMGLEDRRIVLKDQYISDSSDGWTASANMLMTRNAKKLSVDILGRINFPRRKGQKKKQAA